MRKLTGLLLVASACTDATPLADVRSASLGVHLWDCSGPNVPVGCDQAFVARIGIGGDGIGSRFSTPECVTLSSDVRATIDEIAIDHAGLGGEYEGTCEDVMFLQEWSARPPDLPTNRVVVADGSTTFELELTRLFGERRIDIISPTGGLHPGDHVEALLALPSATEAIEPGSVFVCNGDCPSYVPFTLVDHTIRFDVPTTPSGTIKMGAHVLIPIERCAGATTCTGTSSVSIAMPVVTL